MYKQLLRIFTVTLFILINKNIVARAGGGGGHSGGGGHGFSGKNLSYNEFANSDLGVIIIIGVILLILYAVILTYLHFIKSKKSKKVIKQAVLLDELWNFENIKKYTFEVFTKMQVAWENRSLGSVKSIISKELYNELDKKITELRSEHKKNILEEIEINQITLISCVDFKDNSKDTFTAQIDGQMIDYKIDDRTKIIIENTDKNINGFTDCYEFIRIENKWILNKIYNDSGIFNLLDAKNHFEK